MDCCCSKNWASAAGLAAVVLVNAVCEADVVFVVDMDSFHHTQAWLLLFLTETTDWNAIMIGCCCHVWGEQVLPSSTGSVVWHHHRHVTLPMVTSLLCKAQSLAPDGLECSFASMHVVRELNIAKCMCGSFIYKPQGASYRNHQYCLHIINTKAVCLLIRIFLFSSVQSNGSSNVWFMLFLCGVAFWYWFTTTVLGHLTEEILPGSAVSCIVIPAIL